MVKKHGKNHSNECQFYITTIPMLSFDKLFVAFGRIIQGFNVIKEIESVETNLQRPIPSQKIKIVSCGEHVI